MKLWLIRTRDPTSGAWDPWYDKAFGFVVRAETEGQARKFAARLQSRQQVVDALRLRLQLALLQGGQALLQLAQVAADRHRVGHQQFGGGRRRGRAQVGNEVGETSTDSDVCTSRKSP